MSAPTALRVPPRGIRRPAWRASCLFLTALVVSCGWGAASLWMHESWPPPWDVGGNSIAMWVIVPFLLGRRAARLRHAALVGLVSLLLLVASYYLTLWVGAGRGDFASVVLYWAVAAAVLGGPLGVLGLWSIPRTIWGQALCALPGAVFISEALPTSVHFLFYREGSQGLQALWAALAVAVTLWLARRASRGWLVALLAMSVLTAVALMAADVSGRAFVWVTSALG